MTNKIETKEVSHKLFEKILKTIPLLPDNAVIGFDTKPEETTILETLQFKYNHSYEVYLIGDLNQYSKSKGKFVLVDEGTTIDIRKYNEASRDKRLEFIEKILRSKIFKRIIVSIGYKPNRQEYSEILLENQRGFRKFKKEFLDILLKQDYKIDFANLWLGSICDYEDGWVSRGKLEFAIKDNHKHLIDEGLKLDLENFVKHEYEAGRLKEPKKVIEDWFKEL